MRASSSRTKTGVCAYCGRQGSISRDHVPPKALFGKPRPNDLITVPACEGCHSGTSKDDEYFRAILLSSELVGKHPEAQKAQEVLIRGLKRPEHGGLLKDLNERIGEVEVWSPEGYLYLGKRPAIEFDVNRIQRVIARVIRGLFFREKGYPVPGKYGVMAQLLPVVKNGLKETVRSTTFEPERVIACGAFRYFFQGTPEDSDTTMWVLHFYERLPAVGFTALPELVGSERMNRFQWQLSGDKGTPREEAS